MDLEIGDLVEVTTPDGKTRVGKVARFHPAPPYPACFMLEGYLWWFREKDCKLLERRRDVSEC
ncbi:MAG: hypothetical protein HKO76_06105 [Acidimicrobiia bacterium]|nr:hypothetical protein [Acidimicrobiia bacterium]